MLCAKESFLASLDSLYPLCTWLPSPPRAAGTIPGAWAPRTRGSPALRGYEVIILAAVPLGPQETSRPPFCPSSPL